MVTGIPQGMSVRLAGSVTVVEITERRLIDAAQIERLGAQLQEIVKGAAKPKLVVSFANVEYLSSSMLNVLISVQNSVKAKGGDLCLSDLDPELKKVFTLMKLQKLMTICGTTDEAVKRLQQR